MGCARFTEQQVKILNWRDELIEARILGIRRVRDSNGEELEYRSDSEMAAAIKYADQLIKSWSHTPANTIVFNTSKGV